jgi:hypothetical protein
MSREGLVAERPWVPGLARLLGVAMALGAAQAHGAEPGDRRDRNLEVEGLPSLPGLSHRDVAFNFEYTVAVAEATDVISHRPIESGSAYAYSARWLVETELYRQRWYFGATNDVAAASVPSGDTAETGGSTVVLGNPEIWFRGLWSSASGLSAGGGLGMVIPVPRTFSGLETEVVRAIRVVRPGTASHFQDMTVTARPFFDIRHITGPLTLQMRQGLDFSLLLRDRADHENRYDLTGFLSAYLGLTTLDELTLAVEVSEVYELTADVSSPQCPAPCDEHRAAFTLSPIIRLRLPRLSPALSALIPLSTPLRAEVASYFAVRLHLNAVF